MSGSIRSRKHKDGKITYQVVIEKGVDGTGKRLRDYYSFQTKKAAQAALAEMQCQQNRNTYTEPSKLTVSEALEQWFQTAIEPNHKENTKRGYLVNIAHIKKGIGTIPLQKLTPVQIQAFYNQLEQEGFSPRTIQYIHTNLKTCLKHFCRMQILTRNPAEFATVPKQVKPKNDCYTEQEVKALLEQTKNSDIFLEILLAVGMGLRRGEVLALTWADVSFQRHALSINKSMSTVKGKTVVSSTKTAAGERTLKIPQFVVKALAERRQEQWEQRKNLAGAYQENNLVCARADGSYYNSASFTSKFSDLLERTGLRHVRYHDLRHTHATLMMKYKIPVKVISESLGHASTGVTMDTYSHVTPDMKAEVAEKLDNQLFSKIG